MNREDKPMLIRGEISSDQPIEMISRHPGGKLTRRPVAKGRIVHIIAGSVHYRKAQRSERSSQSRDDDDPGYRIAMRDAGRGHLIK